MKKAIKYLLCVSIIVLTLTGCGRVPKLKDGSELVFELNGLKMTTEDFYQELKDNYGTQSLINAIDGLLLNKVYETTTDMKTKIDSQVTQLKNQYGSDFQDFLSYNNIASEKALKNLLEMSYKRELAIKDYAATLITDKDIEKYYNEKTIGDIKASHILIKSEATDDMTDEEKKAAEEKALATAKEVIKKLNDGAKFEDLAKEYSKDSSASDGGNLGYFNRGEMVSEFEDAAVALKVNEYTKEPVKTQFGYHIILKTDQKDKPKLEEAKDNIKDTLINNLISNTENISIFALDWLREKNELKIYDAELKIRYDHYMNEQKSN
ncbi:MAG: peptidylprolyl isomerase [Bacilli bacterium]|nr:peptidylprolyl isomerase [Bacilli bacterium]MBQ6283141.1 peptidylprolyl isomerase [Bacilli bacterium]